MSSLHNVDGELPETLGSIKSVTDSQEAVMSFYYTDAANQVRCVFHPPKSAWVKLYTNILNTLYVASHYEIPRSR